ncbi:MAG: CPBP family intramembrane metalloprotease [Bacteroidales bacterium]|nr:CPBP family intramembrane metalloprotease [Bacteroidales bacterium]
MGERNRGKVPVAMFPIPCKLLTFAQKYRKTLNLNKPPLLHSLTPFMRLLFTVILTITCFLITFMLGLLLASPLFGISTNEILVSLSVSNDALTLHILQYFQVLQSIGLFIIPALLAGFFFGHNSLSYLGINRFSKGWAYLLVIAIMFVSLPFINWMITINEAMQLPAFLKGVETWMKATEDQAAKLTEAFMKMPDTGSFLFNMLMIAILPAIGEELMFRGLLQRLLKEWLKNIHVAIFISAFFFAAMHLQFYGLLPRFMLGLLFGYLFYWSGSLWVPVAAHFINNGAAVMVSWLGQLGLISGDYENFGITDNVWLILLSAIITGALLVIIKRKWNSGQG